MTLHSRTIEAGISNVGERLLNLQALVRFALHQVEHSEPSEFAAMRSEWCTLMYLLQDQINAAQAFNGDAEVIEREMRFSAQEARH